MSLNFDIASCVKATSKFSTCSKCVDICPVDTIVFQENIPSFTPSACIDCGACVGACPSGSFSLSQYSGIDFFFSFIESKNATISCKEHLPCLAMLSVEELLALAIVKETTLELGYCKNCEIGGLYKEIVSNIEEVNFILSSFGDKHLDVSFAAPLKDQKEEPSRRSFLSHINIKKMQEAKEKFDAKVDEDELKSFAIDSSNIEKLKPKTIPARRKLLLTLLKRLEKPSQYELLPQEEIRFISQKYIEESCTNCQICYRICPTGALSSDSKFSRINFDSIACIKCHLCHDVCEPDAIKLQKGFENQELFEPRKRTLIEFDVRRCNECGNYFTYFGGEQSCQRCQIEEEESIFLHQNAKKLREL
jgi:ferredoxin